jgi:hypothetical protein
MARRSGVVALAVLGLLGLGACELPVPPPTLVVTTTVDGPDAVPGDGVCEMTAGVGDCSLQAAVGEGNALGAAAITLPAGSYAGARLTVTGDLSITQDAPVDAEVDQWIEIAAGGRLVADGLARYGVPGARIEVHGTFVGRHLSLVGLESIGQVAVGPTGTAVLENSLFVHVFGNRSTVTNAGTLVMRNVALLSSPAAGELWPALANSGTAVVSSSVLQSCSGTSPTSGGYNSDHDGSCGLDAVGDQPGAPPAFAVDLGPVVTYELAASSPLVDAIPVGVHGCGADVVDDLRLRPRPVDGDGDGVAGCDIGASERPASP